jgi:TrmH family RNA methyltransferase
MLSKNEIKYIQSLCHKKQRQQSGLFIVEGVKQMEELLLSDFTIKTVYATDDWEAKNIGNTHLVRVTVDELKKISVLQTPNKVLALSLLQKNQQFRIINGYWP